MLTVKKLIFILVLLFHVFSVSAVEHNTISLFSYSGYLTTPSAYISDGQWGFHYTYLPLGFAPFDKNKSDNWVFSSSLGFLPFVEVFFSVYVAPDVNISSSIPNYGADKTRSPGLKIQLLRERESFPAFSVGIYDPLIGKISNGCVSSVFIVSSKHLLNNRISVSLGYGLETFNEECSRLKGIWGGSGISLNHFMDFLVDYDGEAPSAGVNIHSRGFDASIGVISGNGAAFRFGYKCNLLR